MIIDEEEKSFDQIPFTGKYTPIQGVFSSIDMNHIQYPQFKIWNKKLKVSGGHNLDTYPEGSLILLCFKGQLNHVSNNAMIVFMRQDVSVSKTVVSGFDEAMIRDLVWNPTKMYSLLKDDHYFNVYRSLKDRIFFGAYLNQYKQAKTIFPILVVDGSIKNKSGKINIGAFCYMSSDYKVFTKPLPINVTVGEFNDMMRKKPLLFVDSSNTIPLLSDITDDVNNLCRKIFNKEGYRGASILQIYGYNLA